jgi:hypothetical protein
VQINWARVEEPAVGSSVVAGHGGIFFLTRLLDFSAATSVAVTEKAALSLSGCDRSTFLRLHAASQLSFSLFANVRCIRRIKTVTSAIGSEQHFVNLTMADATPACIGFAPAPNVSSMALLAVAQQCAENKNGLIFARFDQIKHCPIYGIAVSSDGGKVRNAEKVVVLINVAEKSVLTDTGSGFLVTTAGVTDHPALASEHGSREGGYRLKGYCEMDSLLDFKLDPPRGQSARAAVAVISQVEMNGTDFVLEAVEHVDQERVAHAVNTMKKLIKLSGLVETENRDLGGKRGITDFAFATPPASVKKCRTLTDQPSDASL